MMDDTPNPNPDDNASENAQPNNDTANIQASGEASNSPLKGGYPDLSAKQTAPTSETNNAGGQSATDTDTQAGVNASATDTTSKTDDAQAGAGASAKEGGKSDEKPPTRPLINLDAKFSNDDDNFDNQSRAQENLNQPNFDRVERRDYEALEKVYVESDEFTQFYQEAETRQDRDYRIYFIRGERNSGRYATALYLALKLSPDSSQRHIYEYVPELSATSLRLLDIVRRATNQQTQTNSASDNQPSQPGRALPNGSIIIIRDMFDEAGGNIRELSDQYVRQLRHILDNHNLTLILTTTHSAKDQPVLQKFPLFSTTDNEGKLYVDLRRIYDRFLDRDYPESMSSMREYRARLEDIKGRVLDHLKRPSEIDYFFNRAQSNIPQTDEELDTLLAQLVGEENRRSQTRPWFESLTMNEKLYAMFVVLFRGLAQYDLDELYDSAIEHLRETMVDDYWLADTRPMSDEKLHEVLLLKRRRDFLDFRVARPQEYIEEIERQIVNHHRLLLSLTNLFIRRIKNSRPNDDVQIRRLLATALGYIGEFREKRLERMLDDLASQPEGHVASSVAFSLAHLARRIDNYPLIIETLRRWMEQKDYDLLWSAIISLAQVYEVISNTAQAPISENDKRYAEETLTQLRDLLTEMCNLTREFDISKLRKLTHQTITEAIHEALQDTLQELDETERPTDDEIQVFIELETVKRTIARQVAISGMLSMSIIRTIHQISQKTPADMVNLLRGWLIQTDTQTLSWQLGRMASNFLFLQTTTSGVVDERHLTLLDLLPALLDASIHTDSDVNKLLIPDWVSDTMTEEGIEYHSEELRKLAKYIPIHTVIEMLEKWYDNLVKMRQFDETALNMWHDMIYPKLLHLVNVSGQHTRPVLVDALIDHWLNSPHEEVRRSAMALLTRCYVMDGVVLALPVHQYGAVLLDSGQIANEQYRTWAFNLLQRLATLTPLRIYHLGWIGDWYDRDADADFKANTPLHLGRFKDETTDFGTITRDDLHLTIARPRLITPLMEAYPNGFLPFTAHEAHFILCLNLDTLADMDEFVGAFSANAPVDDEEDNIFLRSRKPKIENNRPDWAWFGKLFLLGNRPKHLRHMPDDAVHWLGIANELNDTVARNIEHILQGRIIAELHQKEDAVWKDQLRAYRHKEHDVPDDFEALWAQLDVWVGQLDDVPEVIPPRDITLTITSTVLLWSKGDMPRATEKVVAWLTHDDEMIRHIGRACTKILFNFYRNAPYWEDVKRLEPLLTLCVPFMKCQPKFDEVFPILQTGLEWAKHKAWSDRLLMNGDSPSEFIVAFTYLDEREDVDSVLNHLVIRETVLRIQSLFMDVGKPIHEFMALIQETIGWAIITQYQRQQAIQQAQRASAVSRRGRRSGLRPSAQPEAVVYQPIAPPQGISPAFANELLELPSLNEAFRRAILSEIYKDQHHLLDKNYIRQHRDMRANIQAVIDSTRIQLYNKRTGELPTLPANTRYGVVLVDVSASDQISRSAFPDYTIQMVNSLLKQSQTMGDKVMMLVHRLGRQDILAILEPNIRKTALRPDEIIPKGLPTYPSLLMPILDAYNPQDTQFVAIITNKPAHDWADIADNPAWTGRVFVVSETSVPLPMGIERIPLISETAQSDRFETVAKDMLNKTKKLRRPS